MKDMNVEILKNCYLKEDGKLDREESKLFSGKVAGVCYAKEGYRKLENEDVEKTKRRISMTMDNGHHSVYDHVTITLNLENIPKILAMVLNNEHQYTTSEKSARYTKIVRMEGSVITENEEILYNKWLEIFKIKIKEQYGNVFDDSKITKLAQENARYLVTVFCPTTMVYTTTFRQINYIASWMKDYIEKAKTPFELKLAKAMKEFISCLEKENILEPGLMTNDKCRKLSIFGSNLENKRPYFGDVYQTLYKGSRCTFNDYKCSSSCNFKEGINCTRKI